MACIGAPPASERGAYRSSRSRWLLNLGTGIALNGRETSRRQSHHEPVAYLSLRPEGSRRKPMDMNRFTEKAQEALVGSQSLATRLGHQQVEAEHLLHTMLDQEGGL